MVSTRCEVCLVQWYTMPYRLKVTEEEVKQELDKMGFKGVSDDTVAALRKDLLKMIKSDLRKLKHERQDSGHTDTSDPPPAPPPPPPATHKQHSHHKGSGRLISSSSSKSNMTHKDPSYSLSEISQDRYESTGESGYSDIESTMSGVSEAESYSSDAEIPQRQTRSQVTHKKSKLQTTEVIKNNEETHSRTCREHEGISRVKTTVPYTKPTRKTQTKQTGKKGLPKYPSRPDPVRLYHYYKTHWDQYKVPGEDPRLKLRWDIRSKLFYGE